MKLFEQLKINESGSTVVQLCLFPKDCDGVKCLKLEAYGEGDAMARSFEKASALYAQNKKVNFLSVAESISIWMYTLQDFFKEFNRDCSQGRWRNYVIYSALLYRGCLKLAQKWPVEQPLFRGTAMIFQPFRGDAFYWSNFTSASLSREVAKEFADQTIVFKSCSFGARISSLSAYPGEEEVLILPFEQFRKTRSTSIERQDVIFFYSTPSQPLLRNDADDEVSDADDDDDDTNDEVDSDTEENSDNCEPRPKKFKC